MATAVESVLSTLAENGGECDYNAVLAAAEDEKDAHFAASMLISDGYIYEPTAGVVKIA